MMAAAMPHNMPPIGHGNQNIESSETPEPMDDQSPRKAAGLRNSRHRAITVATIMMIPHTVPVSLA